MENNRLDLRSYDTDVCRHEHDFAQLVLPLQGTLELEICGRMNIVNQNRGAYIQPGDTHCFSGSPGNLFLVMDLYNHKLQLPSTAIQLNSSTQKFIQFTHHYFKYHEGDLIAEGLINQLLLHFTAAPIVPVQDSYVLKAKTWIDTHFKEPVDLSRITKYCYLSLSQLQRRFKKSLGSTLAEYWRLKKIQHAKTLLIETNCSIEMIATMVGYENLSAFSRRFHQVVGQSPKRWRVATIAAKKSLFLDNLSV